MAYRRSHRCILGWQLRQEQFFLAPTSNITKVLVSVKACTRRSSRSSSSSSIPFYGEPANNNNYNTSSSGIRIKLSALQRVGIAVHSATCALADPKRADSVAALGEVTGHVALRAMYDRMRNDATGQRILRDKPIVDTSTMDLESLRRLSPTTFGRAYASFMDIHGFDPDDRSCVRYVHDPELAYVMQRYRQIHDFLHVLYNLPPTVVGELALKWVELLQTNLPVTALSVLFGPLSLLNEERHVYDTVYKPWAVSQASSTTKAKNFLMNVYFEELFGQDLDKVREALDIIPAPSIV